MSKSLLSFVWVAGPLSGLIMQPVVGVWSDNCTSRFGRRRPFMVIGSILVGASLMLMAWTREFVELFISTDPLAANVTIVVAVFSVFAADFSVNAVQACCRAIIVDSLPKSKQELANAWAGRMVAVGHLIGFYAGFLDLRNYITFLGDTQLKILCAISSLALLFCVGVTSWAVEERVLTASDEITSKNSVYNILSSLLRTGFHLPKRIRQIFTVQLFAWYGWFTFLFYSSTWVGEIYVRYDAGDLSDSRDLVGDIGRVGSLALTIYSIVTVVCSLILPLFVVPPNSNRHTLKSTYEGLPEPLAEFMHFISPYRPTLVTAWICGHLVYALAMFASIFVRSVKAATFIIGLCGFSWALASWAPYALLAEEIRKLTGASATNSDGYESLSPAATEDEGRSMDVERDAADNAVSARRGRQALPLEHLDETAPVAVASTSEASTSAAVGDPSVLADQIEEADSETDEEDESSEQAGIYLGLHNVSITIPQFISTFVSFIVFSILDPGKSDELTGGNEAPKGVNAIGVTLQLGGITALGAAYMTYRLKKS
ncbi:hypothetical protein BZA70DRAFT_266281 [Myxozyma melibiosi]|uniref:Sucrose transporter n=1 Tax=Myxozyma melibiosi TaxID=54550 RepID=A0ABR1FAV4_9ASCO